MTSITILGLFRVTLPNGWAEITSSVDADDPPTTFARLNAGSGALQISAAVYEGGTDPKVSEIVLQSMLLEFGKHSRLGKPSQLERINGKLIGASAVFRSRGDYVKVWYLSDRLNVLLATYVCQWRHRQNDRDDCDCIIKSIEFVQPTKRHRKGAG